MQQTQNRRLKAETSIDYFLDHGFAVHQFRKDGHRSGLDAIFLAATVDSNASGRVADFAAGAGVVGMAVAHRCPKVIAELYELDRDLCELTCKSMELDANSHLQGRVRNWCADVGDTERVLGQSGLKEGSFDYVLTNPPFNDGGHRVSPDERRARAHMTDGIDVEQWIKSAHRLLRHRGRFNLIIRPSNLAGYLNSLQGRFGGVVVLPLHSKEGACANRILVGAVKGSRAALQILPSFIIHQPNGSFAPAAESILRGQETLSLLA